MTSTVRGESTATAAATTSKGRGLNIALWVVQVLMAAQFAFAGFTKLSGDPMMVAMVDAIGTGQWLRVVLGVLEVAGAIGLLIPRLTVLAAACFALLMVGAIITQLAVLGGPIVLELVLLVVAVLIAVGRRNLNKERQS